jgi:hypothetical protein
MPTSLAEGHVADGDLIRLMDGEMDAAERGRVEAHAGACPECAARLHRLHRRSARLTGILLAADPEAPPAPTTPDELTLRRGRVRRDPAAPAQRQWLRAAAVVALLLGVGIVASPLRAVVADWLGAQWERIAAAGAEEPAPPAAAPADAVVPGTRVQFTPQGAVFTVEVETAQAAGAVELRRAEGGTATAQQVGGAGEPADLLVLPAGVRIHSVPGSTADYRITVPASVRTVRVRVGGSRETVLTADEVEAGTRVEVAGP